MEARILACIEGTNMQSLKEKIQPFGRNRAGRQKHVQLRDKYLCSKDRTVMYTAEINIVRKILSLLQ